MAIRYMNGVKQGTLGKGKLKALVKKVSDTVKKDVKKVESTVKKDVQKVGKVLAKVSGTVARPAFILATKANVIGLGKRMYQAWLKNPAEVTAFWKGLGGNDINELKKAIATGSKQQVNGIENIYARSNVSSGKSGTLGQLAATLAAATPIIVAAVELFKKLGSDKAGDSKDDSAAIAEGNKALLNDDSVPKVDSSGNTISSGGSIFTNPWFLGGAVIVLGGGGYYLLTHKNTNKKK